MKTRELLALDCIVLHVEAKHKEEVWEVLADRLQHSGVISTAEQFVEDVAARESMGTTGVGHGVSIPHAKSAAVDRAGLAIARLATPVDVNSLDGTKADLFFMVAAPLDGIDLNLQMLSTIARMIRHDSFLAALRTAPTAEEVLRIIGEQEEQLPK
ncbi:PTS sugar transporter subunit IIA [Propionispora vibrioides]|uniref:PTS system, nitrogen regulatory IIA component n=1 Tax=Propionispora vibrioides TaxID=112903 RepID=A0A1H8RMH1_9FIRM|nr:PTS sugar transporter subunit IIA [Propionispora vibrioides]SEO67374.1 PTS system, nitrogen regulatory IIA component [Propionispora vibrioides]